MLPTVEAAHQDDPSSLEPGIGRWVDNVLGGGYHGYRSGGTWSPAVDVYEDAGYFYAVVDLAGVHAGGIGIRAEGQALTVTGSRPGPQLPGQKGKVLMHLMEIDQGPFERTIGMPDQADVNSIEATFRSGFLWIRLPRRRS